MKTSHQPIKASLLTKQKCHHCFSEFSFLTARLANICLATVSHVCQSLLFTTEEKITQSDKKWRLKAKSSGFPIIPKVILALSDFGFQLLLSKDG